MAVPGLDRGPKDAPQRKLFSSSTKRKWSPGLCSASRGLNSESRPRSILERSLCAKCCPASRRAFFRVSRSPHAGQQTIASPCASAETLRRTLHRPHRRDLGSPTASSPAREWRYCSCISVRRNPGFYVDSERSLICLHKIGLRLGGPGPVIRSVPAWEAKVSAGSPFPVAAQAQPLEKARPLMMTNASRTPIGLSPAALPPPPRASSPGRRWRPASETSRSRFQRSRSGHRPSPRAGKARCW